MEERMKKSRERGRGGDRGKGKEEKGDVRV